MLKQISRLPHLLQIGTDRNGEQFPVPSVVFAQSSESCWNNHPAVSVNDFSERYNFPARSIHLSRHCVPFAGLPWSADTVQCEEMSQISHNKYHDKARRREKSEAKPWNNNVVQLEKLIKRWPCGMIHNRTRFRFFYEINRTKSALIFFSLFAEMFRARAADVSRSFTFPKTKKTESVFPNLVTLLTFGPFPVRVYCDINARSTCRNFNDA